MQIDWNERQHDERDKRKCEQKRRLGGMDVGGRASIESREATNMERMLTNGLI
jgi:hypothetical protein